MIKDSTWTGGYCRSFKVANTGTATSRSWKLVFTLPTAVKITQSWSGTVSRSGNTVTVLAPSWAGAVAPSGNVTAFGFCATGSGEPSAISVTEVAPTGATAAARSKQSRAKAIARARVEQAREMKLAKRQSLKKQRSRR